MCWRDYAIRLYRCGWSMGRAWEKVMAFYDMDDIDGLSEFVDTIETVTQMRLEDVRDI